jgi:hypothetical protein
MPSVLYIETAALVFYAPRKAAGTNDLPFLRQSPWGAKLRVSRHTPRGQPLLMLQCGDARLFEGLSRLESDDL